MPIRPNELAARYVRLWNETDPELRHLGVPRLYAPGAIYVFYRKDPLRGLVEIEQQMAYTHSLYDPMGYVFRSSHNAVGHHNVVRLNWAMVGETDGEMEMAGQDLLVLDDDGLILADYQFHDRLPASFVYNDGYEEHGVAVRSAQPQRIQHT